LYLQVAEWNRLNAVAPGQINSSEKLPGKKTIKPRDMILNTTFIYYFCVVLVLIAAKTVPS